MPCRLLIAVKSCTRDTAAGLNQAIRETWGRDAVALGVDVRFFVGGTGVSPLLADEIRVDAPDEYIWLPYKTRAIARWALAQNYDYAFLCDTDTFLLPDKLLQLPFSSYDYCGFLHSGGFTFENYDDGYKHIRIGYWWASGGVGYFLSAKSLAIISSCEPFNENEDLWIGQVLNQLGVFGKLKTAPLENFHETISWHLSKRNGGNRGYEPKMMYESYRAGRGMSVPLPPLPEKPDVLVNAEGLVAVRLAWQPNAIKWLPTASAKMLVGKGSAVYVKG
jgi:hypothetical protein